MIKSLYFSSLFRCMVRNLPFYFAVLLPVCLIIIGNFIILVLVMHVLKNSLSSKTKVAGRGRDQIMATARIGFACNALLGVTWVFAIFAVKDATMFFQWLFCISNSLQGLFIFTFYTVRNQEVRKEWMRCFGIDSSRDDTSTNSKLYSTGNKSRYDSNGKTASTSA